MLLESSDNLKQPFFFGGSAGFITGSANPVSLNSFQEFLLISHGSFDFLLPKVLMCHFLQPFYKKYKKTYLV